MQIIAAHSARAGRDRRRLLRSKCQVGAEAGTRSRRRHAGGCAGRTGSRGLFAAVDQVRGGGIRQGREVAGAGDGRPTAQPGRSRRSPPTPPMRWPSPSAICTPPAPCSGRRPVADRISPQNETAVLLLLLLLTASSLLAQQPASASPPCNRRRRRSRISSTGRRAFRGRSIPSPSNPTARRTSAARPIPTSQDADTDPVEQDFTMWDRQSAEDLRAGAEAELLPGKLRRAHQAHRPDGQQDTGVSVAAGTWLVDLQLLAKSRRAGADTIFLRDCDDRSITDASWRFSIASTSSAWTSV